MAADPVSVTLTVGDPGADEPRLERTVTLDTGERVTPTDDDELPVGGDYDLTVDVADGPRERYRRSDVRLERAPMHVLVDGGSNVLFTLQVG